MNMLRRVTALLAMIAIVGLLLMLIWAVELHRQRGYGGDEPSLVSVSARAA